jgi:hypothetical protein
MMRTVVNLDLSMMTFRVCGVFVNLRYIGCGTRVNLKIDELLAMRLWYVRLQIEAPQSTRRGRFTGTQLQVLRVLNPLPHKQW